MIRKATPDDITDIMPLLLAFYADSPFIDFIPPCLITLRETLENLEKTGILMLLEKDASIVGAVGFALQPSWFNSQHLQALELFYYIYPHHRGAGKKLLDAALENAKSYGVVTFEMGAVPPFTKTEILYDRMGLTHTDRKYLGMLHHGGQRNKCRNRKARSG